MVIPSIGACQECASHRIVAQRALQTVDKADGGVSTCQVREDVLPQHRLTPADTEIDASGDVPGVGSTTGVGVTRQAQCSEPSTVVLGSKSPFSSAIVASVIRNRLAAAAKSRVGEDRSRAKSCWPSVIGALPEDQDGKSGDAAILSTSAAMRRRGEP